MPETEQSLEYFYIRLSSEFKFLYSFTLSDLHYGSPYCQTSLWLDQISLIASIPNCVVVLAGDMCESAIKTSKGDIFKQVGTPQDQRDWVIKSLLPIKDKIIGATLGNHEERIYRDTGVDICKDIATALECPYDPDGLYLRIAFGNNNNFTRGKPFVYLHYASHGYGGARTKGAKAVKAERLGTWVDADLITMSHDHEVNVADVTGLHTDNRTHINPGSGFTMGKVVARKTKLVKTNAFLKWGGYARSKGFGPVSLDTPIVLFSGEEKPWPHLDDSMRNRPQIKVLS